MDLNDEQFIKRAIELARQGMNSDEGGPFGAIIVNRNGDIIGEGNNQVTSTNDPTAHAEVVAIRNACNNIRDFQLEGCTIYTSCEPCPMCLGAIYWSRPERIVFACSREDAANIGFDDDYIYKEIPLPINERQIKTDQVSQELGMKVFAEWQEKIDKTEY